MRFENGHVYHIYNQGNNKQEIFQTHEDYKQFIRLIKEYIIPHCDILAWCLLPNHFHLMICANEHSIVPHQQGQLSIDKLTNGFRKLLSNYAHDYNKRYNRSGSLFRPKTKSKDLSLQQLKLGLGSNDYYLNCFYYVHQNPFRHQLVTDLTQWKYSSFSFYAGHEEKDFCNKELAAEICEYHPATFPKLVYERMPEKYLAFFEESTPSIRQTRTSDG